MDPTKVLNEIKNPYTKYPIIVNIQNEVYKLKHKNISLKFSYVSQQPAYLDNIKTVKYVDTETQTYSNIPYKDAKTYLSKLLTKNWDQEWKESQETFLHKIRDSIFTKNPANKFSRTEQIKISRLKK